MRPFRFFPLFVLAFALMAPSVVVAGPASAPTDPSACTAQVPYGQPVANTPDPTVLICRHAYLVLSDTAAKVPVWDAYLLTAPHAMGCLPRSNAFTADSSLPNGERAKPTDYAHSGYDIGHIAPDGDMSWDETVERESFILTNMSPQLPGLNRGIWKELETNVRAWAYERNHALVIYAGPIYTLGKDKTIGDDKVDVPGSFYKIVVDTETKEVMAFIFPQAEGLGTDLTKMMSSVADVQEETGIRFPLPAGYRETPLWTSRTSEFAKMKKKMCGGGAE